jgi:hypothetical protein
VNPPSYRIRKLVEIHANTIFIFNPVLDDVKLQNTDYPKPQIITIERP